jgi:hypothetical protein
MRTRLRRLINDVDGVEWSDAELNTELNDTYAWVQKEIYKVFPEAHLYWDNMDATSDTSWYPLPQTFGVSEFGYKAAATDTAFKRLDRKTYENIKGLSGTTPYYCQRGQWLGIFPAPSVTITNGLELVHTPIMQMSADTDTPRIKLPLHMGIVYKAVDQILGDTDQNSQENRQRLSDLVNDIPLWYETTSDDPDRLQPSGIWGERQPI